MVIAECQAGDINIIGSYKVTRDLFSSYCVWHDILVEVILIFFMYVNYIYLKAEVIDMEEQLLEVQDFAI